MIDNSSIFHFLNSGIAQYNSNHTENKIDLKLAEEITILTKKFLESNDLIGLGNYLSGLQNHFSGLDVSYILDYLKIRGSRVLSQTQKSKVKERKGLIQGFIDRVQEDQKQLIVLDNPISYSECKKLMSETIQEYYQGKDYAEKIMENKLIYPFLISKNIKVSGNLILKKSASMEMITLISIAINKDTDDLAIRFLGEKQTNSVHNYSEPFYVYLFVSDDKKSYYLLTKQEQPAMHCIVEGMVLDIADTLKLGTTANASTSITLIIATDMYPDINTISETAFFEYVKQMDHEKLATKFLNQIRHIPKFEKLLFAWLFSSKQSGYPLHLMWIGPPGTSKSWTLTALAGKVFSESVLDLSNSTMKALIPSFGGNSIEPGFLLRCTRVACVDEFFRAFKRGADEEQSGLLTTLLEGTQRAAGSGKHSLIDVKFNARLLMTSNPQLNLEDMASMANHLDRAFMSRILFYVQTEQHVQFVKARRIALQGKSEEEVYPKYDAKLIEMVDFLQQQKLTGIDYDYVYERYNGLKYLVEGGPMQPIYESRYDHHFLCLIDGIAKYNIIIEGRTSWEVTKKDISDAEEIFKFCLMSWNPNLPVSSLDAESKVDMLPLPAKKLFDYIVEHPNNKLSEIEKAINVYPYKWINLLKEFKLVKEEHLSDGTKVYHKYVSSDKLL